MKYIEVNGNKPLYGTVKIQGSKNAALPIVAATIISGRKAIIHNCPRISDIFHMINILLDLDVSVDFENNSLIIDTENAKLNKIHDSEAMAMRSSITLAGALLSRFGRAILPYPGGCIIGKRPIDLHMHAFRALGAIIEETDKYICITGNDLVGNIIEFPKKSVGATENAILAAVGAKGITHIVNGAIEPEIMSLCDFLRLMGVNITYSEAGDIFIEGTKDFRDVEYRVVPDRIVAGTYIFAAAATGGMILLRDFPHNHMKSVLETFVRLGGTYKTCNYDILIDGTNATKSITEIDTESYPGFPTDLQSQLMAVLAKAKGTSIIRENIFESRFNIVDELNKLGAKITVNSNEAIISGVEMLSQGTVTAKDLRGGAALVIAALSANGTSKVLGSSYIDRGYENICRDLQKLGADIKEGII